MQAVAVGQSSAMPAPAAFGLSGVPGVSISPNSTLATNPTPVLGWGASAPTAATPTTNAQNDQLLSSVYGGAPGAVDRTVPKVARAVGRVATNAANTQLAGTAVQLRSGQVADQAVAGAVRNARSQSQPMLPPTGAPAEGLALAPRQAIPTNQAGGALPAARTAAPVYLPSQQQQGVPGVTIAPGSQLGQPAPAYGQMPGLGTTALPMGNGGGLQGGGLGQSILNALGPGSF
jgi:hypothetical protein